MAFNHDGVILRFYQPRSMSYFQQTKTGLVYLCALKTNLGVIKRFGLFLVRGSVRIFRFNKSKIAKKYTGC